MIDNGEELPPKEFFDEEFATSLVGKTLLVGITHLNHNGEFQSRSQFFGRVIVADRRQGVCVRNEVDGSVAWYPPDTRGIKAARPGKYTNRATGEVVHDPDFTAAWVFTAPPLVQ